MFCTPSHTQQGLIHEWNNAQNNSNGDDNDDNEDDNEDDQNDDSNAIWSFNTAHMIIHNCFKSYSCKFYLYLIQRKYRFYKAFERGTSYPKNLMPVV